MQGTVIIAENSLWIIIIRRKQKSCEFLNRTVCLCMDVLGLREVMDVVDLFSRSSENTCCLSRADSQPGESQGKTSTAAASCDFVKRHLNYISIILKNISFSEQTGNLLKHKLCSRPDRSELVRMHILQGNHLLLGITVKIREVNKVVIHVYALIAIYNLLYKVITKSLSL